MIKNKTYAIILAVLTFLLGSILLISILFYILGYPLSSIPEHQLYVFTMILISALLASMVYGRGSKERAARVVQILEDSFGVSIKEDVIWKVLRIIEQLPPGLVDKYVKLNINAAEEFEDKLIEYRENLSDEDLSKIKKIIYTPIDDLQLILNTLYKETKMEQFKVLADQKARSLIKLNVDKLKEIIFQ